MKLKNNFLFLESPTDLDASLIKTCPFVIEEGLIRTYPLEKVLDSICKTLRLKKVNGSEKLHRCVKGIDDGIEDYFGVAYPYEGRNGTKELLVAITDDQWNKKVLDSYLNKYGYFSASSMNLPDDWIEHHYEKKYDNDVSQFVKAHDYIYQVQSGDERGRYYFLVEELSGFKEKEKAGLLKISTASLPKDMKFYLDPRIENGIYSTQGIPNEAITIIEENI